MSRVGFVGAGRMGAPMVRRLVESGHGVRALGRSAEKRTAVAELGAHPVAELSEVADGADIVAVCVFTDDQVRGVCLDGGLLDAMSPGSVLVVHTTGSPRTAEALAVHSPAVRVIDAPVSGGPHDIAARRITLFVGGDEPAVEQARPVLTSYADPILHVGRLGSGQWVKLINNALFAAQLGMLQEAVTFGSRVGVDETALLGAISHGSAASRVTELVGSRGSVQGFIDAVGEFIGKDVAVVRTIAAETGNGLGLLDGLLDNVVHTGTKH